MSNFEYSPQYIALAQLRNAFRGNNVVKEKRLFMDGLVRRGLDVNYAIPPEAPAIRHSPQLLGWTALHFAIEARDLGVVTYLIERGAKVAATNYGAYTPIRLAIEYPASSKDKSGSLRRKGMVQNPILAALLTAQCDQQDASNPSCRLGISHLHIACILDDSRFLKGLLAVGASAEASISADSPHLAGFRPIHVAVRYCAVNSLELLLSHGVDSWAQEAHGLSPLQLLVECNMELADLMRHFRHPDENMPFLVHINLLNERMANLLLARCAEGEANQYGIERLHVAATMKDSTMLLDALKENQGFDKNAAISKSSPHCPGYTPLHFAARCGVEAVHVLVVSGADLSIADACGITPLDICFQRWTPGVISEIMSLDETLKGITFTSNVRATLCKAVNILQCGIGDHYLYKFLRKLDNVNDPISLNSPLWPGCTLLHLAVALVPPRNDDRYMDKLISEFNIRDHSEMLDLKMKQLQVCLKLIDKYSVNPIAQDLRNFTPVHLAFRQGEFRLVRVLLSRLCQRLDVLDNLTDLDGLSLLHISVTVGNSQLVEAPLRNNADVNARTSSTIRVKWNNNYDKSIHYFNSGSTPLHFAVVSGEMEVISNLISRGADPLATDAAGLTPIILAFLLRSDYIGMQHADNMLSSELALRTNFTSAEGLSHFHVACWSDTFTAVQTFLRMGVDINAKINCSLNDTHAECSSALNECSRDLKESLLLSKCDGYTPLHFAVGDKWGQVARLLMSEGANVHAKNAQGMSPLHMALLKYDRERGIPLDLLIDQFNQFNFGPLDDYGITPLHIACCWIDENWINRLLDLGHDLNAQIAAHSPIWPRYTPLHVLVDGLLGARTQLTRERILSIFNLLVARGADVTLFNADDNTPLHVFVNLSNGILNLGVNLAGAAGIQNLNVNQTNKEGLSLVHVACLTNSVNLLTELCMKGADVNRPQDYFAEVMGGCGPLHFAAVQGHVNVVQLLIHKGANVTVEDSCGLTILHIFCHLNESSMENIIPMICQQGADVNARDIFGRTPLQLEVQNSFRHEIVISLLHYGARFNIVNVLSGQSLFCMALKKRSQNLLNIFNYLKDDDIFSVTEDGSTAIHNSVHGDVDDSTSIRNSFHHDVDDASVISINYSKFIEKLLHKNCSINAKDDRGRTALLVAVEHDNYYGVSSLLAAGINVNIADINGKVALNDGKNSLMSIRGNLMIYLEKLTLLGLEVSEPNRLLQSQGYSREYGGVREKYNALKLRNEINRLREKKIYRSLSLREVMSERALLTYPTMPRAQREAVLECLASSELYEEFDTLSDPIRYQYRRLLERIDLFERAKDALGLVILGIVVNPCLEQILIHLNNEDLKMMLLASKPQKRETSDNDLVKCKRFKSESA